MPHKIQPLPGYTYEGIHGDSNGPRMLIATAVTLGLAIMVTILRLIVKSTIVHSIRWDDWLASAAVLLAIVRTAMLSVSE